jgi:hypothetical protein
MFCALERLVIARPSDPETPGSNHTFERCLRRVAQDKVATMVCHKARMPKMDDDGTGLGTILSWSFRGSTP